jgi:hypothetical protein
VKFIEIRGGMQVPISNDEQLVLEKIKQSAEPLPKRILNLREQELARQLVHRSVIDRIVIDEQICFIYNELDDIWS